MRTSETKSEILFGVIVHHTAVHSRNAIAHDPLLLLRSYRCVAALCDVVHRILLKMHPRREYSSRNTCRTVSVIVSQNIIKISFENLTKCFYFKMFKEWAEQNLFSVTINLRNGNFIIHVKGKKKSMCYYYSECTIDPTTHDGVHFKQFFKSKSHVNL